MLAENQRKIIGEGMSIRKAVLKVPSSDGRHTLDGVAFVPDSPVGILHVVHGMAEHIGRYEEFMKIAAGAGYVVCGYDNLGHGKTAGDGELGFIAEENGYDFLARDVLLFSERVKADFPGLPYFLMGHSMGSFIVRLACERYVKPEKLIVMGTGGRNPLAGVGLALIGLEERLHGKRYVSAFVDRLTFGSYNKTFEKLGERDELSWLTKDVGERDKYRRDPACGFKFTLGAMRDLVMLNRLVNRGEWFAVMGKAGIPVLLLSGEDDPVGGYGAGVKQVYERLKSSGADVRMKLYAGCRHEILNDDVRGDVVKEIVGFIGGK